MADQQGVTEQQLNTWFVYHSPTPEQAKKYEALRAAARELAFAIVALTPPGADQREAIALLRKTVMVANSSIACEGA